MTVKLSPGSSRKLNVHAIDARTPDARTPDARVLDAWVPEGFVPVVQLHQCKPCAKCGHPVCPLCEIHYAECPCPGPHQDDVECVKIEGVLYGRSSEPQEETTPTGCELDWATGKEANHVETGIEDN